MNEDVTERVRLSPGKDENLGNLYVIHKLSLPHREESEEDMSKSNESSKMIEPGSCLNLAVVSVGVESILVTGCLASAYSPFKGRICPFGLMILLRRRKVRCK